MTEITRDPYDIGVGNSRQWEVANYETLVRAPDEAVAALKEQLAAALRELGELKAALAELSSRTPASVRSPP